MSDLQKAQTETGKPLPQGYRQGVTTAISVFLGFSLAFLRFWGFEAPGEWTPGSILATVVILVSIACQAVALFRALEVRDDDEGRYRTTVNWFRAGVILMTLGVVASLVQQSLPAPA